MIGYILYRFLIRKNDIYFLLKCNVIYNLPNHGDFVDQDNDGHFFIYTILIRLQSIISHAFYGFPINKSKD